jgi:hypothetical protein
MTASQLSQRDLVRERRIATALGADAGSVNRRLPVLGAYDSTECRLFASELLTLPEQVEDRACRVNLCSPRSGG